MGIVFRQSVKTTLVVLSGAILGAAVLWLQTKYLDQQQYGFTTTLSKWAIVLSVCTPIGLNNTLAVFIHRYNNEANKRKMLLTICLVIPAIITLVTSVIYFLIPGWVIHHFQPADQPLMQKYYIWLPIYTILFVYMSMLEQYLCSQMKVAVSSFMREILLRVLTLVLIFLFIFKYVNFSVLVIGTVLLYLVPVLIFFLLSFQTKGFGLTTRTESFTVEEYKEIVHFSWYHYLFNIAIMLMGNMDALLIPFYDHKGFTKAAVYTVAVYFISLVSIPYRAIIQASFASFAAAFNLNEMDRAKDLFIRSSINVLIPTICLALLLCCNLNNAVAIIGSSKNYSGLIPVFLVLLLGALVNLATGMNDQVLSITNYYKFNFYVSLCVSVLMFLLIRFLVPQYGIIGAAWASTITIITHNLIKFYFVWKKVGMQPFSMNTVLILIAALPALAAGYFFPYFFNPARHVYIHTFVDAAVRSTIIVIVYVLMLIWLKPSKDLKEYLDTVVKNKRLF